MRPTRLGFAAAASRVRSRKLLSMLLAVGLGIAWADAALAGPTSTSTSTTLVGTTTTTTTTTSTTLAGATTTTTTTSTVPTTTGVPTTTTTTTTTTAPPTTTTTAPPTTTTTTTLPGLSGVYPFLDKATYENNKSLMDVDTVGGEVCLSGSSQGTDATVTLNRVVTFSYVAFGTISKDSDTKVQADFKSVQVALTLDIKQFRSQADGGPIPEYNQTIVANSVDSEATCKLKGSLTQPGGPQSPGAARDKVSLDCDLGPSFEDFPDLNEQFLSNIENALGNRKVVKIQLKKGRLKIKTSGIESLSDEDQTVFGPLQAACVAAS